MRKTTNGKSTFGILVEFKPWGTAQWSTNDLFCFVGRRDKAIQYGTAELNDFYMGPGDGRVCRARVYRFGRDDEGMGKLVATITTGVKRGKLVFTTKTH